MWTGSHRPGGGLAPDSALPTVEQTAEWLWKGRGECGQRGSRPSPPPVSSVNSSKKGFLCCPELTYLYHVGRDEQAGVSAGRGSLGVRMGVGCRNLGLRSFSGRRQLSMDDAGDVRQMSPGSWFPVFCKQHRVQ